MNSFSTKLILLCLSASLIQLVHSQGNCERITLEILGNTTHEEPAGLTSKLITPGGETQASPPVRVKDFNIVCEAQATTQFRYRYTSVVVSYTCTSLDPRLSQCDGSDTLISQFDLGCNDNDEWTPNIFSNSMFVETAMPSATLSTTKESRCGVCANATHPFFIARNATIESDTHCERCIGCTEGLMRCTNRGSDACCNYFLQGQCVEQCTTLAFNAANECVCMELDSENGNLQLSDGREIGSIANITCDSGYQPEGGVTTVVCTTSGWSNPIAKCSPVDCDGLPEPENGNIVISTFTFMSTATYTCDPGFVLEGDSTRTCMANGEWSGTQPTCTPCGDKITNCAMCAGDKTQGDIVVCSKCVPPFVSINGECKDTESTEAPVVGNSCDIGCIIGIILAILAVIVIAIVIAVVVFVLYKYLNDPATKLAKTDTEGLNGVARDNPLYVDPSTVVEEGVDAPIENGVSETTPLDSGEA